MLELSWTVQNTDASIGVALQGLASCQIFLFSRVLRGMEFGFLFVCSFVCLFVFNHTVAGISFLQLLSCFFRWQIKKASHGLNISVFCCVLMASFLHPLKLKQVGL